MTIHRVHGLSLLLVALTSLSGCSSVAKKSDAVTREDNSAITTPADAQASSSASYDTNASTQDASANAGAQSRNGANGAANGKYSALGQPDEALVHFGYDADDLSASDQALLRAHVAFLKANPRLRVQLNGHTDERGTVNYNLALGERRGNAVRAFLMASGVTSSRIEVVSFGETKPVADGQDESAWASNRRVELVYP